MASSFTTNKKLEKPGNGDYVDTWNIPVNADLDVIDQALGTVTSVNVSGGNVTLADTQYRSMGLTFIGALSASRTVTIPSGIGGSWIITNNTTDSSGGPWSVSIRVGSSSPVNIFRGKSSIFYSDGTNIYEVNINAPVGNGSVTSVGVSGGSTGLTTSGSPITTSGTITISGTLIPTHGGTGITSYTVGDLLYASSANTLSALAGVATGNALISGGIAGAPSWGKIGLTTHVSGTLPVANGGTGVTTSTGSGSVVLSSAPTLSSPVLTTPNLGTPSAVTLTNGTGLPIVNGTTGTLTVARGGTGLTSTPANGQIDIGNGTGFTRATLTAGSGILITNGAGAVTIASNVPSGFSNMQVFTSTTTWTVPAGITKAKVTVVGGGGGGGGVNISGTRRNGNGGGSGGAAIKLVSNLTPGDTVTVTVGTGGTGVSTGNGNAGGTSSFGAYCSATGGSGGTFLSNTTTLTESASSGSGSSGDINLGGSKKYGVFDGSEYTSGPGGDGPLGLGFGGGVSTEGAGAAGTGYGGGGGGAKEGGTNLPGGNGAPGIVIVEY